jgi:4-amino-4-deoxy-L-arabinose transferase-like glycosyltransferase
MGAPGRSVVIATVAWVLVLAALAALLAVLRYQTRDPDSVLYARMAAQMSDQPMERWIAPTWPSGSYAQGLYREHPVGVFVRPALLARAGYPAEQAAYVVNAIDQIGALLLLPVLAAAFADRRHSWRLASLVQLVPIAFTYRIRANQEATVLLCLVVALVGTELSRERPAFALLTAAALDALALVKGLVVVPALVACLLWLLACRLARRRLGFAWWGLVLAVVAILATALAYDSAYTRVTGESFLGYYLGRAVRADPNPASRVSDTLYNLFWYGARVVWFAAPWSVLALFAGRPRPEGTADERGRFAGALFVLAATLVYLVFFSLGQRRAERYIFPAYFLVAGGGALAAQQRWPRLARALRPLDSPYAPIVIFAATVALHLIGGLLHLPRIKLWAPDV